MGEVNGHSPTKTEPGESLEVLLLQNSHPIIDDKGASSKANADHAFQKGEGEKTGN